MQAIPGRSIPQQWHCGQHGYLVLAAMLIAVPLHAHADEDDPAVPMSEHAGESPADASAAAAGASALPASAPAARPDEVLAVEPIEVTTTPVRDAPGGGSEAPDARRGLDEPEFVTVVRIDERAGESSSVAEVLASTMGVHVRSLGGLGSYSSVAVRGAASSHTAVLIDGVPLSQVASASADIGRFDLQSFATLELYRGSVPVEMGGAAVGGALNLITGVGRPASGSRLTLSTGGGSFGARHLRARWRDGAPTHGYVLSLSYAGATGDFRYFNDKGTNLDTSDDEFVPRQNNGYDQLDAVARARTQRGDLTIEVGIRSLLKLQGLPGSASVQSTSAALTTASQLVDVSLLARQVFGSPRLSAASSLFGLLEWQHFRDRKGEVGLGVQERRYRSLSAGGAARLTIDAGETHLVATGVEARVDAFRDTDELATEGAAARAHGLRTMAALTVQDEISLAGDAVVLAPALRLDLQRTVPLTDARVLPSDQALAPRNELFASPRLAYRVRLASAVAVKGSMGRYFRAPTVIELFGDRGYVVGNPGLAAENGYSADLGLVAAPALGLPGRGSSKWIDRVYLESALFGRRSRNTIAFVTTAGLAAVAVNLGHTRAWGVETGLSLRVARALTLSGNYTWLDTRQDSPLPSYDRKPLPRRPRHQLYARAELEHRVAGRRLALWGDVTFTTGNYLDAAGLSAVPARQLVGAGVKLEPVAGMLVGIEGKNLMDERVETVSLHPAPRPDLTQVPRAITDFSGYPLPGRAFYLTVEWNR